MRTFAQIPLSLWGQASFIALPNDARLALLYIWAGPHSESAGVSVLEDGYAGVDLDWPADRWVKAREQECAETRELLRQRTSQTFGDKLLTEVGLDLLLMVSSLLWSLPNIIFSKE
jgi:hypothetical protein